MAGETRKALDALRTDPLHLIPHEKTLCMIM
jgi:hypothetical protein